MKLLYGLDSFEALENTVVTTGAFDGVHLGHQKILTQLKNEAKKKKKQSVVLTFSPHPRHVLYPDSSFFLLNTYQEKHSRIANFGIDYLINIFFDKKFSKLTAKDFIKNILINKLGVHTFIIGYNHHFGKNQEGSFNYLKEHQNEYTFSFKQVNQQKMDGTKINSTSIRKALINGNIDLANQLLGYHFSLSGKVIKGNGMGHKINYPTANLLIENQKKIIPKIGSYAVQVSHERKTYDGMLNIGHKPTVQKDGNLSIEVNIFNFNQNIYNQNIDIQFIKKIRDEQKFSSITELKAQLLKDKSHVIDTFNSLK